MTRTMRAIAVDDEPLGLTRIRKALERHPDVELVAEAADGDEAVARIRELSPDVVFLDIRMPGRDGFDVVAALPSGFRPAIVFVTAYDEHALEAFEVHAADYLVKPFDDARFDDALGAVRERLRSRNPMPAPDLDALLDELGPRTSWARRIRVTEGSRTRFVPVDAIRYLESDGNYVVIHTDGDTHRVRVGLAELHGRLDPSIFARVHRGTVLNLDRVREIQPWFSGAYIAIMDDGKQLKISRTYRDDVLKLTS